MFDSRFVFESRNTCFTNGTNVFGFFAILFFNSFHNFHFLLVTSFANFKLILELYSVIKLSASEEIHGGKLVFAMSLTNSSVLSKLMK